MSEWMIPHYVVVAFLALKIGLAFYYHDQPHPFPKVNGVAMVNGTAFLILMLIWGGFWP